MSNKQAAKSVVPPSNTGTGAGSASNDTGSGGSSASAPVTGAPIVGPKGFRLKLQQMIAGWQAVLPTGSSVPYEGGALGQATILSQLQGYQGNYTALDAAQLALKTARGPVTTDLPAAKALLADLKVALVAFFGPSSPQLASFGLKPKGAKKQISSTAMAAKVARAQNTRDIRGTKGKIQKADLKSGPMAVAVAPAAAPTVAPPASK